LGHVKDAKYRDMFIQAAKNYEVVLDNGAFEDSLVHKEEYFELISQMKPAIVVAPDLLNANANANLRVGIEFAEELRDRMGRNTPQIMFVPQCERGDTEGFYFAINEALNSHKFQWLGICRNACYNAFGRLTHTADESINKLFFGMWAEQNVILQRAREEGVRFHMLGIGGNFALLQKMWWVERADTASLFFQSTLGNHISRDGILSEAVYRPPDFFYRDFGPDKEWADALTFNCNVALKYASNAKRLRNEVLGERI